jgi:trk system potassium uptake protein TrkA
MNIIVIGAGEVGFDVSRMLSLERHDVTVVDTDPDTLQRVRKRLDVLTVHGNGTAAGVLEESGVENTDLLVAVTSIDEVNIISCMIADRMGVETTIARIRSNEFTEHRSVLKAHDLGIDLVIHPEESAGAEVVRLLRRASATDVLTFANEKLQLVGIRLDNNCPVLNRPLQEIMLKHPELTFRVMAINRGARTILPRGDETLQKNDQIFVLSTPDTVQDVTQLMGKVHTQINKIMVLGGSAIGRHVAEQLQADDEKKVKVVESDRTRAEQLAQDLSNVLVIHGDATDIDLLTREGMGEMDAFVAVNDDEESNLVSCLLAKHIGVFKTVARLSKGAYIPISQTIGLDAAVSEKLAVSREILRFLRGKHVLSVATVHGLDAEILEIEANENSPITEAPLKRLNVPGGVLIGAVIREDDVVVATGGTHIRPGDQAIVFAVPGMAEEGENLFR